MPKLNKSNKVGLQNVVFEYYCSPKINQSSLENWLVPDLGQKRYKKHLEHLDLLEKIYQRLPVSRSQSESAPTGQRCENMRIKKDINCNELKHTKLFESTGL